jgi:transposase-like protein
VPEKRTVHETLTVLDYSAPEHRRLLNTTNSMEHDHLEVRRRSRVVRVVSGEASLVASSGRWRSSGMNSGWSAGSMKFKQNPRTKDEEVTQIGWNEAAR